MGAAKKVVGLLFVLVGLSYSAISLAMHLRDSMPFWLAICIYYIFCVALFWIVGTRSTKQLTRADFIAVDAVVMMVGASALLGITTFDQEYNRNVRGLENTAMEFWDGYASSELSKAKEYFCKGPFAPERKWGKVTTAEICQFFAKTDKAISSAPSPEDKNAQWKQFLRELPKFTNKDFGVSQHILLTHVATERAKRMETVERLKEEMKSLKEWELLDFVFRWLLATALALGTARYVVELQITRKAE
jgi:hypothetical protein